jgi:hypothetical protein
MDVAGEYHSAPIQATQIQIQFQLEFRLAGNQMDFIASNPGLIFFHCHTMHFGFMALFDYSQ